MKKLLILTFAVLMASCNQTKIAYVDIEVLMKRVGLWEDRDKMVGEYSKGMKIRLNIVRALLNEPKMLFLDEPTNGLDPTNAQILKDMIKEFRKDGGTVFITSHIKEY